MVNVVMTSVRNAALSDGWTEMPHKSKYAHIRQNTLAWMYKYAHIRQNTLA